MARIRTIKPSFWSSLSNADLPIPTRLTWIGLWNYVDDKGRAVDDARLVKAAVWPLDDAYTAKKVEADLVLIAKAGKIGRYQVGGERYLAVVKWREHQRIDKPQKSILPPAPWEDDSRNVPGTPPPNNGTAPGVMPPTGGGEVEGKGSGREGDNRSSSDHLVVEPVENEEEEDPRVQEALGLLADRRLMARSGPPITDPPKWRRTTLANLRADYGDELRALCVNGTTPEAMAEYVDPSQRSAGLAAVTGTLPERVFIEDGETGRGRWEDDAMGVMGLAD